MRCGRRSRVRGHGLRDSDRRGATEEVHVADMIDHLSVGHEFSSGVAAMDAFERTVVWFDKYLQQEESRPIP